MKLLCAFLTLALMAFGGCAHHTPETPESARLPLLSVLDDEARLAEFTRAPAALQPWLHGDRHPPVCLADLGLTPPLQLVHHSVYLDGGSQDWLLRDDAGHYFEFCTSFPGDLPVAFLLGGAHWSEPHLLSVADGTPSFRFLFDLVWAFADDPRYRNDPKLLERVRISVGLSREEFARYYQKPVLPPLPNLPAKAAAAPAARVTIHISGSVAKSGPIVFAPGPATLAEVFERSGGVAKWQTDIITVSVGSRGNRRTYTFKGREFYSGDADYELPDQSEVYVSDCSGEGLGNLSAKECARLQELHHAYLDRRAHGRINVRTDLIRPDPIAK